MEYNATKLEKITAIMDTMRIKDIGLQSLSRRSIHDNDKTDEFFMKYFASFSSLELDCAISMITIRTLEPYLDLKKGLGTKRIILPEKRDDPIPDIPERFLGEDLQSNNWIQDYNTYNYEQEFNGEISVYTTNHFIRNKEYNPTKDKYEWNNKELDNAPEKCYMIMGVQIMSDHKPMVDFIKIQKKQTKTIEMVSTETIWAQPNRLYEFRTPIIYNPDIDIVFQFTPNKKLEDIIERKDNIMFHGWIAEPLGKTVMG